LDSSTLDGKAVETVALATETARQGDAIKIQIMSGTDAAAPVIHNMDLCERRAVAVKAQLVSDGILEGDIAIKGKLFEPLFGSSEIGDSYYRRAVIDLGA
jgi:outer membrane protein OmpA-like peptidoglycan-associated protein